MSVKLRTNSIPQHQVNGIILPQFLSIAERLNLGYTEIQGTKIVSKYIRTDIIGKDVDLFFRCSKYATTCLLTIGDKLFQYAASDRGDVEITVRGNQYERYHYYKKILPKCKLKGINHDYSIYVIPPKYPDFYHGYHESFKIDGCCSARQLLIRRGYLKRRFIANTFNKVFRRYLSYPPYHIKKRWEWLDRLKEIFNTRSLFNK